MNTICKRAVDTYGKEPQINQAIEEMGELIVAINHWKRGKATKADVFSEIADVVIMCDQLCYIVDGTEEGVEICGDIIDQKLKRQEKRINEYLEQQIECANTQK